MATHALALLGCLALQLHSASAGSNGMAMTPPLTWRSWNQYGWYITEVCHRQWHSVAQYTPAQSS